MPQLDIISYLTQLEWFALIIGILYYVILKVEIVVIDDIKKVRSQVILGDTVNDENIIIKSQEDENYSSREFPSVIPNSKGRSNIKISSVEEAGLIDLRKNQDDLLLTELLIGTQQE